MNNTLRKTSLVDEVEKEMLLEPQVACPVRHLFGPGLYIRELYMKAGTIAIGHKQKLPHLNSFIKGRVLMVSETGEKTELVAPLVFVGAPGRKIGYVLEDVIWQNIYATDVTDIDELEKTYLDKSEAHAEHYKTDEDFSTDHADYLSLVEETGLTEQQVSLEVMNIEDQIPMPPGFDWVCIRNSKLHGKGVFSTFPIQEGMVIAPAKIGDKRTPVGRYTNHSTNPNANFATIGDDIVLVASRFIEGCCGGDSGEEVTVDYRQALRMRGIVFKGDLLCQV